MCVKGCHVFWLAKSGKYFEEARGVGRYVLKWGFTQTFPGNQDATLKLTSELIFYQKQFFNTLVNYRQIYFTHLVLDLYD